MSSSADSEPIEQLPYLLRLGITGHRKFQDPQAAENVARSIERTLEYLEKTLRQSRQAPPIHWSLYSSLAEGADQLAAARLGVYAEKSLARVSIHAVLPFAAELYRQDFVVPGTTAEFDSLLAKDPAPTILNTLGDLNQPAIRNSAYLRAGQQVVDRCEILLAVWDGKPARGQGGTAEIVQYALECGRPVLWIYSAAPHEFKFLVSSDNLAQGTPLPGMQVRDLPRTAKQLSIGFHWQAAFARDPLVQPSEVQAALTEHRRRQVALAAKAGIDQGSMKNIERRVSPLFVRADLLATRYQKRWLIAACSVHGLAAFSVAIVVFQVLFFPHANWLVLFELLAMLFAAGAFWISRREQWKEKYQNDRFLAEWLRRGEYLALLALSKTTPQHSPQFKLYQGPEQWFVEPMSEIIDELRRNARDLPPLAVQSFLINAWLRDQAEWHLRKAHRHHHWAQRLARMNLGIFAVTIVMALLHLFGVGHANEHDTHGFDWSALFTFFAISLPAFGAALHGIGSLLDHERLGARSKQIHQHLVGFAEMAEQAKTEDDFRQIIEHANQLMAHETEEWWVSTNLRMLELAA